MRILVALPDAGLWALRRVDPYAPELSVWLGGLLDLAYDEYGLRTHVVIFGERVGTRTQHLGIVTAVTKALAGREAKVTHVEIANEGGHTGFSGPDGIEELRAHAVYVAMRCRHLVALTSAEDYPPINDVQGPDYVYAGAPVAVTMFEFHPDRDVNGDGGPYRPCRQPYGYKEYRLPHVGGAGEPRGPQSSVSETSDPVLLCADAAMVYLCGWARYVLHTGAGVFGMANQPGHPERPANVWEAPNWGPITQALTTLRANLPQDLPSWGQLCHANPKFNGQFPFVTLAGQSWDRAYTEHGTRGYAVRQGNRFMVIALKLEAPLELVAPVEMRYRVRSLTTWEPYETVLLSTGQIHTMPAFAGAVLIEGETL